MENRILLLGLDTAGKTTLLYRMKLNEAPTTIPTFCYNVETIQLVDNFTFTMFDVGGKKGLRPLWRTFSADTHGLVFLVDSVDSSRFEEARSELEALLNADDLRGVPLVLLANKQDLPGACPPPMEVAEQMGLRKVHDHKLYVQGCCAVSGDGIPEAMAKLAEMVKAYRKGQGT